MTRFCPSSRKSTAAASWPLLASPALSVGLALGLYAVMACVGAWLLWWTDHTDALRWPGRPHHHLAALAGAGLMVASSARAERRSAAVRALGQQLAQGLAPLSVWRIGWFALGSAVGEELLFRGPLHVWLGLVPAAVVFGLAHGGFRKGIRSWTWFALLAGLLLGGLREWSGSVWPGVLCHVVVNAVNMHRLRRYAPYPPAAVDP